MEVKIPVFSMFLAYLLRKLKAWAIQKNQVEIERQKQQDESKITSKTDILAKDSDRATDQIDHIIKSN